MKPIARLGDKHLCPAHGANAVFQDATQSQCDVRPIATVGDKAVCGAVIVKGTSAMIVGGRPVATIGSETSHGGWIAEGSVGSTV